MSNQLPLLPAEEVLLVSDPYFNPAGSQQNVLAAEEVFTEFDPYLYPEGAGSSMLLATASKEGSGREILTTWSYVACCLLAGALSLIVIAAITLTFQGIDDDEDLRGATGGALTGMPEMTGGRTTSLPEVSRARTARPVTTQRVTTRIEPILMKWEPFLSLTTLPAATVPAATTTTATLAPVTTITMMTMAARTTTTTVTSTTTATPTTTTPTTTTIPPRQPPPLLCSVGLTAALPSHYPPDGACDILIYTHVRVESSMLLGVDDQISYGAFRNACSLYRQTTCGFSFDARFLRTGMLANTDIRDQLADVMRTARINHYAIMNIYQRREIVRNFSLAAAPAFREFRSLLGNNRTNHKIIFGVGYFDYNGSDSVSSLSYIAENIATSDVDIVVVITSVLTSPSRLPCTTLPANALKSPSNLLLSMEKAGPMAMSNFGLPSLTVAFSFQMGALLYNMPRRHGHPFDALYKQCTSMAVSDYSSACGVPPQQLFSERIAISYNSNASIAVTGKVVLQTFDTLQFMIDKATVVMSTPGIRQNFTWFLFNVHLTDVTGRCLTGGPFERVKGFKEFYSRRWGRFNP